MAQAERSGPEAKYATVEGQPGIIDPATIDFQGIFDDLLATIVDNLNCGGTILGMECQCKELDFICKIAAIYGVEIAPTAKPEG